MQTVYPPSFDLLDAGIQLSEQVLSKLRGQAEIHAIDEDDLCYKSALLFFFAKAYKSYQAFGLLWREGFVEDAAIIARTVFELALQARYMASDPKLLAKMHMRFHSVARYKHYESMRKAGLTDLVDAIEAHGDELIQLKHEHDEFLIQFHKGDQWHGKTIRSLAQSAGTDVEREYITVYWWQSNSIHSSVVAINDYIGNHENSLVVSCYPSPSGEPLMPHMITKSLVAVIRITCEAFVIESDQKELERLLEAMKRTEVNWQLSRLGKSGADDSQATR